MAVRGSCAFNASQLSAFRAFQGFGLWLPEMFDVEISEGIATVTLNRAPVNAMSDAWMGGFHGVLDDIEKAACSLLLLRSGLKLFSAGADLRQLRENFELPPEVQAEVGRRYQQLFARVEALPLITVAEIHGAALGGGLELALACDLRFVARDAKMGLPEVGLGLIPGAGGTQRLTRLCGIAVASRMILGAEVISGEEGYRLGLAQWCVDSGELADVTRTHSRRMAGLPSQAIASAKVCIAAAAGMAPGGFDREVEQVRSLLASSATRTLVRKFLDRQKS